MTNPLVRKKLVPQAQSQACGRRKAGALSEMRGAMLISMVALLLTKMMGFLREILIVHKLGYGSVSDGFYVGQSIPDLFYQLLIGGAIAAAVTPTLSAAIENDDEEAAWKPINTFFSLILVVMIVMISFGQIFTPQILRYMNPGKDAAVMAVAVAVARIVFAQTFIFVLLSEAGAILNANKVFGLPTLGNFFYTFVGCAFLLLFGSHSVTGARYAALGIVVGALVYFSYIFFFARPYLGFLRFSLNLRDPAFRRLFLLALPALISGLLSELKYLVHQYFTSQFAGAVTSVRNANTLINLPYDIIVLGISTVLLANLSGFYARGAYEDAREFLTRSLRLALYLCMPFAVIFLIFHFESVQAVYQWNPSSYSDEHIRQTAYLLRILTLSLPLSIFTMFYSQSFLAIKKSWVPLLVFGSSFFLKPISLTILIHGLGLGLIAIPIDIVVTDTFNFLFFYFLFRRMNRKMMPQGMGVYILKLSLIAFDVAALFYILKPFQPVLSSKVAQLVLLVLEALAIFLLYYLASYAIGLPESRIAKRFVRDFLSRFSAKRRPKTV